MRSAQQIVMGRLRNNAHKDAPAENRSGDALLTVGPVTGMDTSNIATKLDTVLAAVERIGNALDLTRTSLEGRMDTITSDFTLLRADQHKLSDLVRETETALADLYPWARSHAAALQDLLDRVCTQEDKLDDAEGRNNVRVVGLPEGAEGRDPETFTETWLWDMLPS